MFYHRRGFTLVEILIVVVIIAIVSAIAVPAYNNYVRKGRRSVGQAALLQTQACYERCFTQSNSYSGCATNCGLPATTVPNYYTISVSAVTATSYLLTATPINTQYPDPQCTTLTLNQIGTKGQTGTLGSQCWSS